MGISDTIGSSPSANYGAELVTWNIFHRPSNRDRHFVKFEDTAS
jgi:hypothetical protein